MNKQNWLMTDDDTYQHILKLEEKRFAAVEIISYGDLGHRIRKGIVDLSEFYDSVLDTIAAQYCTSLRDLKKSFGDQYHQLIAEFVFESRSEYDEEFYDSYKDAKHAADEYMKLFFTEEK